MNIAYSAQWQAEAKWMASLCQFCDKPLSPLCQALDTVVTRPWHDYVKPLTPTWQNRIR